MNKKIIVLLAATMGVMLAVGVSAAMATTDNSVRTVKVSWHSALVNGSIVAVDGSDITVSEKAHPDPKNFSHGMQGVKSGPNGSSSNPAIISVVVHAANARITGFGFTQNSGKKKNTDSPAVPTLSVGERVMAVGASESDGSLDATHVSVVVLSKGIPKPANPKK